MHWNRSNVIGLAKATCQHCNGEGIRPLTYKKEAPCNCVLRAVFRICYRRFRRCVVESEHIGSVSLEFCHGRDTRRVYSRKREEYMADFCLIARRELDAFEYPIFRFHYLLGAEWGLCCRQLKLDRGYFFHIVYSIEQKLGRCFAELEPYGLFPPNEYFSESGHDETCPPTIEPRRKCPAPGRHRRLPAVA